VAVPSSSTGVSSGVDSHSFLRLYFLNSYGVGWVEKRFKMAETRYCFKVIRVFSYIGKVLLKSAFHLYVK